MPNDRTRNVTLTAELNDFIRAHVDSGRYRNASEFVRLGAAACEGARAAAKRTPQRKAAHARSA